MIAQDRHVRTLGCLAWLILLVLASTPVQAFLYFPLLPFSGY